MRYLTLAAGRFFFKTVTPVWSDGSGQVSTQEQEQEQPASPAVRVDEVEPEWQTDVVYLLHGGYRVAEGTPVVAICTFSNMVMAVMQQMGIPMASITVDLDDRPEWFTRKCKAGQTPAVVYGGEVVEDSAVSTSPSWPW